VAPGDVIAEIETDKATMEVEAIDEGTLGKIVVGDGTEGVPVNAVIGVLLEEGEDASALEDFEPSNGAKAPAAAKAEPEAEAPPAGETRPDEPAGRPADAAVEPEARKPAAKGKAAGNGAARGERIFASPLARRMAKQAGIDLAMLEGSGPHGRIVKADVERAIQAGVAEKPRPAVAEARPAEPPRPAEAPAVPPPAPAIAPPAEPHQEVKLSNIRKVIARRLTESKQTIPHYYLTLECELDALLKLRAELNAREGADYKLSVNDFLIKALALALRKVPAANRAWGGDKLYQFEDVDIGVAVAIPDGLVTPVIRKADQKGLATISNEMRDLSARARDPGGMKLKPEEYQGGSFSISNLGMYGIREFAAVINPPQAGILAVGAGELRPVVKDGALATATMMTATLSADHRLVDGAIGAELLAAFKRFVEEPLSMLL
ncbi:MAG TPA: pyruvate dehydrogenase complex dihydrolipoamide acetyltransferase, partial [Geminicoccaceae bacterium]|nr:pyruvate dehydrogenase complex dihydrolipoamide acetyltransferase [Geminicoccaceae bacterium]